MKFVSFCILGLLVPCSLWAHHGENKLSFNDVNNEMVIKLLQTLVDDDNAVFSPVMLVNSLLLLTNSVSGPANEELLKFFSLNDKREYYKVIT